IDHAAAQGVVIVNLSMGSNDRGDWQAFEDAARAHPDMLFVVSAGNNGRDIDAMPVYPAALELPNILSVTSSENDGTLAFGSNRGARSVDLLVPAERMRVTDFNGAAVSASGSSYAAVRIAALAARLLADHPEWRAAALKRAILERALPFPAQATSQVAHGFLPRPDRAEDLPPLTGRGGPASVTRRVITAGELYAGGDSAPDGHRIFRPVLAYFRDSGWSLDDIREHARTAAGILAGCNIRMPGVAVHELDGPPAYRYFHDAIARELVRRLALPKPAVYFVRDTLQVEAYDAEAIGRGNSAARPELRDTVWITEPTREPGIALAHELAHLLMDRGDHVDTPGNLMRAETAPSNTTLTQRQCRQIRDRGTENGLLVQPGD
ncbi:MAG TPA: S8 family serine peptidase, partial [Arenicellales bacterium]|nr:S8 family serine peptidase [Arenicellales bacterium]